MSETFRTLGTLLSYYAETSPHLTSVEIKDQEIHVTHPHQFPIESNTYGEKGVTIYDRNKVAGTGLPIEIIEKNTPTDTGYKTIFTLHEDLHLPQELSPEDKQSQLARLASTFVSQIPSRWGEVDHL
jgi:hypothetical protein